VELKNVKSLHICLPPASKGFFSAWLYVLVRLPHIFYCCKLKSSLTNLAEHQEKVQDMGTNSVHSARIVLRIRHSVSSNGRGLDVPSPF